MAATTDRSEDEGHYHRKFDRSPENQHFLDLPSSDKRLISNMRIAVEGTRSKIGVLRDEIDNKDLEVSRESALRKAAEARLEQLVDMYGDPAVMEELTERLPRAKKAETKQKWQEELEEIREAEANLMALGTSTDNSADKTGKKRFRRSRSMDDDSDSDVAERLQSSPPHAHPQQVPYPSYPMPGYPMAMPGYPGQPFPGFMYPYSGAPLMTQPGTTSAAGAASGSMPNMTTAGLMPQMMMMGSHPYSQVAGMPSPAGAAMAQDGVSQTAWERAPTGPGDSEMKLAGILSNSSPDVSSEAARNVSSVAARESSVSREQNRQIAILLRELDAAKELNEKLQQQLRETVLDLEQLRITQQTTEAAAEAKMSSRASDMVEEIYRAQKQRDEAILGRLRLANEERDEALVKLRQSEREPDGCDDDDAEGSPQELNIQELLSMIEQSDSAQDVNVHGKTLLNNLAARQQRSRLLTTEEMSAVLEERDNAVAQVKKYEGELLRVQRQLKGRGPEAQMQANTQAKLLATQQERDLALSKVRKMQEELENLRVYYSLHKSLSQEADLRDQFNNTLGDIEGQLRQRDTVVDATAKENARMVAHLQTLTAEKAALTAQLEKAQHSQKEAQGNCQKMERLVNVLRRKLNGLGSKSDD